MRFSVENGDYNAHDDDDCDDDDHDDDDDDNLMSVYKKLVHIDALNTLRSNGCLGTK